MLPTNLSMLRTTNMFEDKMNPPVLIIMRTLHTMLLPYHSIVALQTVSMGRVMKQVIASAMVRWKTR